MQGYIILNYLCLKIFLLQKVEAFHPASNFDNLVVSWYL